MTVLHRVVSSIPAANWLKQYSRDQFPEDFTAGFITAVLLIPQGMAYAILAGLPPEVGLYASLLPPIVYALLGTSRTLSVGPVSVAALLVASALTASGQTAGDPEYLADALLLAALTGTLLLLMALFRLGVLVNFLSHSMLSGFTSGAAVLIILSQLKNLTGIDVPQSGAGLEVLVHAITRLEGIELLTSVLGLGTIGLLLFMRSPLIGLLQRLGINSRLATLSSRAGPLAVIALLTGLVATFNLHERGIAIVGDIPPGLPSLTVEFLRLDRIVDLLPAALMISLIGYVESVSVAKVLAHRRREKIDTNKELWALGASNIAASFTGSMPVAGGFSRSMVNFSAGARTQLAAIITAVLVGVVAVFFTPLFFHLPKAALAGIIVVAVVPLIDWRTAIQAYRYDKADGAALLTTFVGVLVFDIEIGLLLGAAVAIGAFLWRSSRPHIAIVGRVPGRQHYRNVRRYSVETWPAVLLLRVDRSLFFANVSYVEDIVAEAATEKPELAHLVLICSAVNAVDYSALEALEQLSLSLREAGIVLHLAEVKGPVMDRLQQTDFLKHIRPGQVFLSTEDAVEALAGDRAT
jgi:SulP family sulfate permease